MQITDIEKLIEGQKEHSGLDFKASCEWDVKKLAKDILAMSNLPDGGTIIVGVEEKDNSYKKTGVSDEILKSYNIDLMKDQIGKYADPMVDIEVYFPEDDLGQKYVVIRVFTFRETPTICKKDLDKELKLGTIYYRNTNRRVESAAVSNVNDLRDIIELAAVRLLKRRRDFGFSLPDNDLDSYKSDLKSVNEEPFVKKLKERGYCEISVTPLEKGDLKTLENCLRAVEKAQVRLSWDLPMIVRQTPFGNVNTFENGYQGISNFGARKEFWRMNKSEHFYIINSFVEDWLEEDNNRKSMAVHYPKGQYFFYFSSLLIYLSQFYQFLERLTIQGLFKKGVVVSITFGRMKKRKLHLDDADRYPLLKERSTEALNIPILMEYTQQQLLEDSLNLSNEVILKVAEYFDFKPDRQNVLKDQDSFLSNK